MEIWFSKSILHALHSAVVYRDPFHEIPLRGGSLVFLSWYFGATAMGIAVYLSLSGRGGEIMPPMPVLAVILLIGVVFGALANGALFQAIGLAPNPGLPPVMYATSSMLVFFLSVALASSFPALFKPVVADPGRVIGILLVLAGLFLLAGGKVSMLFRSGG